MRKSNPDYSIAMLVQCAAGVWKMAQKDVSSHKAEERGVAVATASDDNAVRGKSGQLFAKFPAAHYTSAEVIYREENAMSSLWHCIKRR